MTHREASEFVDGKHWADIIGCDVRASFSEIKRAAERRTREAMASLYGQKLSERLLELGAAIDAAAKIKPKPKRRGGIER